MATWKFIGLKEQVTTPAPSITPISAIALPLKCEVQCVVVADADAECDRRRRPISNLEDDVALRAGASRTRQDACQAGREGGRIMAEA